MIRILLFLWLIVLSLFSVFAIGHLLEELRQAFNCIYKLRLDLRTLRQQVKEINESRFGDGK